MESLSNMCTPTTLSASDVATNHHHSSNTPVQAAIAASEGSDSGCARDSRASLRALVKQTLAELQELRQDLSSAATSDLITHETGDVLARAYKLHDAAASRVRGYARDKQHQSDRLRREKLAAGTAAPGAIACGLMSSFEKFWVGLAVGSASRTFFLEKQRDRALSKLSDGLDNFNKHCAMLKLAQNEGFVN